MRSHPLFEFDAGVGALGHLGAQRGVEGIRRGPRVVVLEQAEREQARLQRAAVQPARHADVAPQASAQAAVVNERSTSITTTAPFSSSQ